MYIRNDEYIFEEIRKINKKFLNQQEKELLSLFWDFIGMGGYSYLVYAAKYAAYNHKKLLYAIVYNETRHCYSIPVCISSTVIQNTMTNELLFNIRKELGINFGNKNYDIRFFGGDIIAIDLWKLMNLQQALSPIKIITDKEYASSFKIHKDIISEKEKYSICYFIA